MVLAYVTQGVLRYCELRFIFDWHWPWRALARPAIAFVLALAPAMPLRFLMPMAGEWSAALVFLAAYVAAWKMIGLEESDRVVLRQLWAGAADDDSRRMMLP